MPVRPARKATAKHSPQQVVVPNDAPSWVTADLVQKTLEVWQPFYEGELIPEDALAIIMGASEVFRLLSERRPDEAVRSTRESEQS